jgi:acyl phosphate:glycerol-3-phosphate acyltransferase
MDEAVIRGLAATVAGYFLGGVPWGIVVARAMGAPDPRTVGSGRTGGANVLRAAGRRAAILAAALDLLKGTLAVLIARAVGAGLLWEILAGLAAVVGHSRSPYIGFGGGRGVGTAFGGSLALQPLIGLAALPIFLVVFLVSRYSSLASLTSSAGAGVLTIVLVAARWLDPLYIVYAVGSAALIWLFHLDNIQRLRAGTERKLEIGRKEGTPPA